MGVICIFPHTLLQNTQILSKHSGSVINKSKVSSNFQVQYDKGHIQNKAIDIKIQIHSSIQAPNSLILLRHSGFMEELGA